MGKHTRANSKDAPRNSETSNEDLKKLIENIQVSVDFLSEKFDELQEENRKLKNMLKENIKKNNILEERVKSLEQIMEKTEREKLKNNIILIGVAKQRKNENVTEIVNKVFKNINTKIEPNEIIEAYRKDEENNKSPIIVKLASNEIKSKILNARKQIGSITTKECQLTGEENEIFINEQLTQLKNNLFYKARELKKEYKYKFLWTRDGNIYIRKSETSTKLKINTTSDLDKIN